MKEGGDLLSQIALELKNMVAPGITTMDLEKKSRELFKKKKLKPAFLGYGTPPFPATICASVDEEIVHGIPSDKKRLESGQIISIDLGGFWKEFCVDMAFTTAVGKISREAARLINVTKKSLAAGIEKACPGNRLYDISWEIQQVAENAGCSVVRDLVGHGIGRKMHEPPQVPNYGRKNSGIPLEPGMVLALEPMVNAGKYTIKTKDDGWTVVTSDGMLSCHYEKTVAVTGKGPLVLTDIDL